VTGKRLVPALALLMGTCGLLAACGLAPVEPSRATPIASESTGPPPIGAAPGSRDILVALIGSVGAMHLVRPGSKGQLEAIDSGPPADSAWLSSDGSTLVVTTLQGRLVVGRAAPATGSVPTTERLDWVPAPGDLGLPHPTRAFGTIEPTGVPANVGPGSGGGRLALVEGDPGSGEAGRLLIVGLAGGPARAWPLPAAAESAPAWLPDGRLAVVARDPSDRPAVRLVDPGTGRSQLAPVLPLRSVAVAGGLVVAIGDDGTLRAGALDAWLAGRQPAASVAVEPDDSILQAQPSPDGDEVALVVADPAGDAAELRVIAKSVAEMAAGSDAWHEIARFSVPRGANRAVVSWWVAR